VFKWRHALKRGELNEPTAAPTSLLPATVSGSCEASNSTADVDAKEHPRSGGAIRIEFPGRAVISVESDADPALFRSVLESLRK
jgi:hypothetical protein